MEYAKHRNLSFKVIQESAMDDELFQKRLKSFVEKEVVLDIQFSNSSNMLSALITYTGKADLRGIEELEELG